MKRNFPSEPHLVQFIDDALHEFIILDEIIEALLHVLNLTVGFVASQGLLRK